MVQKMSLKMFRPLLSWRQLQSCFLQEVTQGHDGWDCRIDEEEEEKEEDDDAARDTADKMNSSFRRSTDA